MHKPKLLFTGKSKSLDSCDLLSVQVKTTSKQLDKLHEIKETITANSTVTNAAKAQCFTCSNTANPSEDCKRCRKSPTSSDEIIKLDFDHKPTKEVASESELPSKKSSDILPKRKIDVITSFTDSPLFTRKHRFGNRNSTDTSSPTLGRRNEHGFNLYKQLTEGRWRRKEPKQTAAGGETKQQTSNSMGQEQQRLSDSRNEVAVEATPVESRASVSLHTQVKILFSRLLELAVNLFYL